MKQMLQILRIRLVWCRCLSRGSNVFMLSGEKSSGNSSRDAL